MGLTVWWDAALRSGEAYDQVTEQALSDAKAVIVLWSPRSVGSRWVRAEATQADRLGTLVPVMIEACKRPIMFELTQTAELEHWSGDRADRAWLAFVEDVRQFTQRAAGPASRNEDPVSRPSPAAPDSERRHLTVLSCHLGYATGAGEELDPEDWQTLSRHQKTLGEIITRLGGHVAGFGESLVAYFGYPVAQEDAAERAVRAGLAVVDRVAGLNEQTPRNGGARLNVRVGLHAGIVVVAWEGQREAAMFGEVPSIAARVQAAAPPDAVMITSDVHVLVAGLFALEAAGSQSRGAGEPLELYRAVSAGITGARGRGFSPRAPTAFVGRADEARLLASRWECVCEGEGQLVLLTGEPGIGKTRLIEEFRTQIEGDRHLWIECGSGPLYTNTAFHPVIQMLHQGLGWHDDDDSAERLARLEQALDQAGMRVAEAAPLIAEMLNLPTSAYAQLELPPEEKRKRLLAALAGWVFSARGQPMVIVMEDLHWSDPSTMDLIQILADQSATAPLMLLCTGRPEFKAPWPARAHHTQITLNRLSSRQTRDLVARAAGGAGLSEEVMNAVVTRTDGVPLFAEELTRLMREGGHRMHARDIPATLLDSLSARLDRVGRAKEVAQLGSVLGREFSYALLSAISPMSEDLLQSSLATLANAELIYSRGLPPDANYQFKHALILDAAYGALLKSKRRELHHRVATTLVEAFPELAEAQPEVLAGHWTQAGEIDKAVGAWTAAGQRAASRAAHVEAADHLRRALDLLRSQPATGARSASELPLLIGLAVSLAAIRGYAVPEVGEALSEAAGICDALGNVGALFDVQAAICNFRIVAGERDAAEETARRCEEISARTGDPGHLIQAATAMGYVLHDKADLAAAHHRLETVARLYAENDGRQLSYPSPQDPLVIGLSALMAVLWMMGDTAAAERVAADCTRHARSLGRPFDLALSLSYYAHFEILLGNYDLALQHAEESIAISEANGYETWGRLSLAFKGLALGHLRDPVEGLKIFDAAMEDVVRLGILENNGSFLAEAATLHLRVGDLRRAMAAVEEGIAAATRGNRLSLSRLHRRRAEVLAATPGANPTDVRETLREAIAIAEAQGAPNEARQAAQLLAATAGDLDPIPGPA